MTKDDQTLALLERALDQTATVVDKIRADQRDLPTPCPEWRVRELVRHLVGQDLPNFIASASGETPDWQAPANELPDDWAEAFRAGGRRLMSTWRDADLDQPVTTPGGRPRPRDRADQQIAELAMHGWDLATATSQRIDLDPAVAEHALAWSKQMLRPEFRGPDKAFGAEVPVPAAAPSYERLAGWFGRDPAWTPLSERRAT
jgi:uncharacterized protein (TIGR03086 family)